MNAKTHHPCGILLVHKPPGLTSFDVIRTIKKRFSLRRIGHTGTLDKFATGLLILLLGRYTRLSPFFLEQTKEYLARIRLGITTDTLDPEGEVTATGLVPDLETVTRALPGFLGRTHQVPPAYSAVHIDGKRAYQLVRQGKQPQLAARQIYISKLDLITYDPPELLIRVRCSKGTYIRSLARDIGLATGSCGYVLDLTRTAIGNLKLQQAVVLDDIQPPLQLYSPVDLVTGLPGVGQLEIKDQFKSKLMTGVELADPLFSDPPQGEGIFFVFDTGRSLLAVVEKYRAVYRYRAVFQVDGS